MAPDFQDFQRLYMSNCHKQNPYLQQGITDKKFLRRSAVPHKMFTPVAPETLGEFLTEKENILNRA